MNKGALTMSHQELTRHTIIESVVSKHLTQSQASHRLKISTRQVKRLVKRYRDQGVAGLISVRRGQRSNNAIAESVLAEAITLIRTRYADFGPTLAHEKLVEHHGFSFSVETLRKRMISEGIWASKGRRGARIHQSRERRACRGELIQVDGSPHDWFEGRAPKCTLIVFIDDATSELMALYFTPAETTQAYMHTLYHYLHEHGCPTALYSDRHGIFSNNVKDCEGERTQFGRAVDALGIGLINANSPQAKGRVERANQTLQDRLVKEMRLLNISSIEEANAYVATFIAKHNKKFAVPARSPVDAHQPIRHTPQALRFILSRHDVRTLSKNLTLKHNGTEYQLQGYGKGYRLRGARVIVSTDLRGKISLVYQGEELSYRTLKQGERAVPIVDDKTLDEQIHKIKLKQKWRPPVGHPWKKPMSLDPKNSASPAEV